MRILVTGGAGFIGSSVSNKLSEMGHQVTVLDVLSPQIHGDNPKVSSPLFAGLKKNISFIEGSVLDRELLEELLPKHDAVIHLAAETGTGQSMYEIQKYVDVNINGTALILDILTNKKCNVQKFIVASSRSIYGEGKYHNSFGKIVYPSVRNEKNLSAGRFGLYDENDEALILSATDEDSKIHPSSVYGITKQVQEQLVLTVCNSINVSAISLRYQNVYGPGQSLSNPYTGILSIFSTRILNGNQVEVYEDGLESRDFVYIDDVVEATVKAVLSESNVNGIFNVGSGIATSVIGVVEQLSKNYGKQVDYAVSGRYRIGDIRHNYACIDKVKKELGFSPKFSFEAGVSKFCEWVLSQPVQVDSYEKSVAEMAAHGMIK